MEIQQSPIDLTATEAALRLQRDGFNELPTPDQRGYFRIIAEVLRQPMFALLLGGGVVYLLLGDRLEALLLLFASLSVTITIVQESRSERVLEALRNLASPRALVVRGGARVHIAGREVVRGDILVIAEGDRVAADATLLSAEDLLLDESLLTGESLPVRKMAQQATPSNASASALSEPSADNLPHVYAGTLVTRGGGLARVHATGRRTQMGIIGHALRTIETEQPHLQLQLQSMVLVFAMIGVFAGGLAVLLFGLLRGSWLEAMLSGIALGMSLLPEEFPVVMTVFMAMGAWRISQARVLTRRAAAIETLGATTVLCADKTGTLTENRMSVASLVGIDARWDKTADGPLPTGALATLEVALLACAREAIDPMDLAVHELAARRGDLSASPLATRELIRCYGLRPDLPVVTNVYGGERAGGATAYAKGAFEAITALCRLSVADVARIRPVLDSLARDGIRVLGVAQARLPSTGGKLDLPDTPRALPFQYVGLIGFADPLRANVPNAVAECRAAGIRVVMITGDYPGNSSGHRHSSRDRCGRGLVRR